MNDNYIVYKKKSKAWIYVLIGIILIILAITGYYLYERTHNSQNVINNYVSKIYKSSINNIDNMYNNSMYLDSNKDIFNVEGSLQVITNYKDNNVDYSKLKDYSLNAKTTLSFIDKKGYVFLGIKEKNNDFFGCESSFDQKNVIVSCKDLLNKSLLIPLSNELSFDFDEINNIELITQEDIKYFINFNKNYTFDFLKTLKFESSKAYINNKRVLKSSTKITTDEIQEYVVGFLNKTLNDTKMMSILKKDNIVEEDINAKIEEIKRFFADQSSVLTINLYTYPLTAKFIKFEIIEDDKIGLKIERKNNVYNISIGDYEITYDDNKKLITSKDIKLSFNDEELSISISPNDIINYKVKINLKYKQSANQVELNPKIEIKTNDLEEISTVFNIKLLISKADSVKVLNNDTISLEELENYSEELYSNLENKFKDTIFEEIIYSLNSNSQYMYENSINYNS